MLLLPSGRLIDFGAMEESKDLSSSPGKIEGDRAIQASAPEIKAIDRSSVARICSGQVSHDPMMIMHDDA